MLRKHFIMSGDGKPDFTITYHAPKHVPFFGGYAKDWVYGWDNQLKDSIKFKVIGDKWNNGVGEWKFKLEDSSNRIYNSVILGGNFTEDDTSLLDLTKYGFGTADSYTKHIFEDNDVTNIIESTVIDNSNIITSVIFGEGIETIDGSILMDTSEEKQSSCTSITLPESVTLLTGNLFNKYTSLKTITVPLNVIRIDNLCNIDGGSLEEVVLKPFSPPDASNASNREPLGYIENYGENSSKIRVYADCIDVYKNDSIWGLYGSLYDTINNTIVYYNNGDRKLYTKNLDITSINYGMIPQSITNVYLPNSVNSIGYYAFDGCSSLTSVVIPDSVTIIDEYAFRNCNGLTSVEIPDSVTSIGTCAFLYCSELTSVVIPDSVTIIGDSTFFNCSKLTSVEIGNSVNSIGNGAFKNCSKLTSVEIGNSVNSIGYEAFKNCDGLTSVVIGNSVNSIGYEAFYYCTGLTSFTITTIVPPTLGSGMFYKTPSNLIIYVPDESVDAYKSATNWSSYSGRIKPISEKPV